MNAGAGQISKWRMERRMMMRMYKWWKENGISCSGLISTIKAGMEGERLSCSGSLLFITLQPSNHSVSRDASASVAYHQESHQTHIVSTDPVSGHIPSLNGAHLKTRSIPCDSILFFAVQAVIERRYSPLHLPGHNNLNIYSHQSFQNECSNNSYPQN